MLEAQPLHGVVEFDVDAEIVGIELELIAVEQAAGLIDVHDQIGDVAIVLDAPMAISRRIGLEIDDLHGIRGAGHSRQPPFSLYALFFILLAASRGCHNRTL